MSILHDDDPAKQVATRSLAGIPTALRDRPQWLAWQLEPSPGKPKPKKVPYDAKAPTNRPRKASTTEPRTWATFAQASRYPGDGIGFVLTTADQLVFIDLDNCVCDGVIAPWAKTIVDRLQTYTELSQSGKGIHLLVWGALPVGRRKNDDVGIEMYSEGRYIAITGNVIPGTPATIETRQAEIEALHAQYLAPQAQPRAQAQAQPSSLPDDATLKRMFAERVNGHKWESLYAGHWQGYYNSQSTADQALCDKLAFYTGRDAERVDSLFRSSGLMRAKWDKRHRSDGASYGQMTVDKAIGGCTATYSGLRPAPLKTSEPEPTIPLHEQINLLRTVIKTTDLSAHIPTELQSATGYRTAGTDTKYLDSILDQALAKGRLTDLPLADAQQAEKCNFGSSNTAGKCKRRALDWFIIPTNSPSDVKIGTARTYSINPALIALGVSRLRAEKHVDTSARNLDTPQSYTRHKRRDAFARGRSQTAKAKGLTGKPLIETILLVVDTFERTRQPATRKELCAHTGRTKGALASATRRAEELGILQAERSERFSPKCYTLAPDAWAIIDALEPTLKTWKIGLERSERTAERTQDQCDRILQPGHYDLTDIEKSVIADRKAQAIKKRERLIPLIHPDWTPEQITRWIFEPKAFGNLALVKAERIAQRTEHRETVGLIRDLAAAVIKDFEDAGLKRPTQRMIKAEIMRYGVFAEGTIRDLLWSPKQMSAVRYESV